MADKATNNTLPLEEMENEAKLCCSIESTEFNDLQPSPIGKLFFS